MHYMTVVSLEKSDEPKKLPYLGILSYLCSIKAKIDFTA